MSLRVTAVGGPTVVLEVGGLRLLTDPTFSPPGKYLSSSGSVLTKTAGPASTPDDLGPLDAVLLSHDQHPDNLDGAGRAFLAAVPLTVTTEAAAARLGGTARGLAPWEHLEPPGIRVTAVPARHGPAGAEAVDVAVLFAGAARSGAFDNGLLTLNSPQAAEAATLLGARHVVAIHLDQWTHLKEGPDELRAAFEAAGTADRLVVPRAGETQEIAN